MSDLTPETPSTVAGTSKRLYPDDGTRPPSHRRNPSCCWKSSARRRESRMQRAERAKKKRGLWDFLKGPTPAVSGNLTSWFHP